ncbi:MAG: zinc-binding dehydrogenase [Microthrixaceae bacterium]|nr:zinc-binding dehydrogenase [Acidimicrobiales bacterium]MCB9404573.1 zinc-binding dehydrogenase [Microthrixaceae bacterium]
MSHAIDRRPVDVCAQRGEDHAVLGNSGVVRAVEVGSGVENIRPGDHYLFFGTGVADDFGYMRLAHAYDAPGTVGMLARQTLVPARNLFPIASDSKATLPQWAAFSLRYMTAWSNWNVALGCFRTQLSESDLPAPHVWGWGGGSTLAELELAKLQGCRATMVSGNEQNLKHIAASGIETVDRREFPNLTYDADRYGVDHEYRQSFKESEKRFLTMVKERTDGLGVQIFIDYIGLPTLRVTQKALGRCGVIATAGWKHGMDEPTNRAMECIARHIHVYTHYARFSEVLPAMDFAERNNWLPRVDESEIYDFDEIPRLVADYAAGQTSYYPIYRVNAS